MVRSTMPWLARSPAMWWAIAGALSWGAACSAAPAANSATLLSGVGGGTEERDVEERDADKSGAQTVGSKGDAQKSAGDHNGSSGEASSNNGDNASISSAGSGNTSAGNASNANASNGAAANTSTSNTNASNATANNANAGNANASNATANNAAAGNANNANAGNAAAGNANAGNAAAGNTATANTGSGGGTTTNGGQADAAEEAVRQALTFDLPEPSLSKRKRRKLWATYYYVPEVEHLKGGFSLRNMDGAALGPRLSRRNWCNAAMQGTVLIRMPDGSSATYNYAGTRKNLEVDCSSIFPRHRAVGRTRFIRARGRWGDGSGGRLLPLRTIAADPRVIPDGSTLYIPAARGTAITLPDGSSATHDGFFYAADHGGAIKQNHIDVFVGVGRNNPFAFVRSNKKHTFEAYIISPRSPAAQRLRRGHRAR